MLLALSYGLVSDHAIEYILGAPCVNDNNGFRAGASVILVDAAPASFEKSALKPTSQESKMRSTNHLFLRGHVGQTPKKVGKVAKVSVATNRTWYDDDNKKKEQTDWVTVTILSEKIANWVLENVKKGDPVYVEARVAENSYEKDGQKIYTTDIIATVFDSLVQQIAEQT